MRLRPKAKPPFSFEVYIIARAWSKADKKWVKSPPVAEIVPVQIDAFCEATFGSERLAKALDDALGTTGYRAEVRVEFGPGHDGSPELAVLLVNTTDTDAEKFDDPNLYQCAFEIRGLEVEPFMLEALTDSFRFDRKVLGYGINCGVERVSTGIGTTDVRSVDRRRPQFWNAPVAEPDLRFTTLASDPLGSLAALARALDAWGDRAWCDDTLERRAAVEGWSPEMLAHAREARKEFEEEKTRVKAGVELLANDANVRRAFQLMNAAVAMSAAGKYDRWRPFQVGFLLANLAFLRDGPTERNTADVVWFATGGGKTETYLGIVVATAFYDRLRGKSTGITAWSRFPLRMLSLQQTQRFADALAAAEVVRRGEGIGGDPFSVGFLVGQGATPNSVRPNANEGDPYDPEDPQMPERCRVLLRCPFCRNEQLTMKFNHARWTLEHRCGVSGCPWPEEALPFFVVDDELYRFLPTVVIGTLDKAAGLSLNGSMRGIVGAPWGTCSRPGHGYTYAPRSSRPSGCLVPGCTAPSTAVPVPAETFAPSLRLQDELHLLRDSLGAVDAHYEALLDHLQETLSGGKPKILGSSATLCGYEKQIDVLYRRKARVFPVQGPSAEVGFWTAEGGALARRFLALAPRGVTVEYAIDRTLTELQGLVRQLIVKPEVVCARAGVPEEFAPLLVNLYGVQVAYGNTLRDLDAVTRSFETQVKVDGELNYARLTGRTEFDEVRTTLARLEHPESDFAKRIHLVAASAMMSHGVDIDRLNAMVMLGVPLTTAEFIQATARVGRRHPGLVLVFPKMARERDASVFRSFEKFVSQGDRFVEPIPITRRSRRVLERTIPGLECARLWHVHEPASGRSLVLVDRMNQYLRSVGVDAQREFDALSEALGLEGSLDEPLRSDLLRWLEEFFESLATPPAGRNIIQKLVEPMRSLRDVEEQAPIFGVAPR